MHTVPEVQELHPIRLFVHGRQVIVFEKLVELHLQTFPDRVYPAEVLQVLQSELLLQIEHPSEQEEQIVALLS